MGVAVERLVTGKPFRILGPGPGRKREGRQPVERERVEIGVLGAVLLTWEWLSTALMVAMNVARAGSTGDWAETGVAANAAVTASANTPGRPHNSTTAIGFMAPSVGLAGSW